MKRPEILNEEQSKLLLNVLKSRFEKHKDRHKHLQWDDVQTRLVAQPEKLWSIHEMEATGGEPDVIGKDDVTGEFVFVDCVAESPKERRSLCYDAAALASRKEFKPRDSAISMAAAMGIELLTEDQYRQLQLLGPFDKKTSSWIKTPDEIRTLGGALFCDWRYGAVFVYHNGAESYYASRGFRGRLKV